MRYVSQSSEGNDHCKKNTPKCWQFYTVGEHQRGAPSPTALTFAHVVVMISDAYERGSVLMTRLSYIPDVSQQTRGMKMHFDESLIMGRTCSAHEYTKLIQGN